MASVSFLDEYVLTASVGNVPVDDLGTHFDNSFFKVSEAVKTSVSS